MDRHNVLVVDDDDAIREVAQVALEVVGGFRVTTASSGADGLAEARSAQPDLVLMDVMMPEMDGPSVLAQLRADPVTSAIPIIFLTAKAADGDHADWMHLGVAGVISKPFDPMTLAADISRMLGWAGD